MPVEIQITIEDLLSRPAHYSSGVIPARCGADGPRRL